MANQNQKNQDQRGGQKEPQYQKNQDQRSGQQQDAEQAQTPQGRQQQNREISERIQPGSDDRGQPNREDNDPLKNYREQA